MLDDADATALTQRIRTAVDGLWDMLLEAHDRRAWKALGYKTWAAYVKAELDMGRQYSYRLLDQGRVIKAIEDAIGKVSPIGDIPEGVTRELKDDLPAAIDEIKARAEQGEAPAKSAKEIAAERRAEKAEKQAELDRQRDEHREKMPEAVKQAQSAKQAAIEARKAKPENALSDADRIEELEEAVRVLEAENATLKAENKHYGEMKVQWEAGGYEQVIAGKDEVIRVLETRLYSENANKVSWMRSVKWWKEQAIMHGWSNEEVIDLEAADGR